VVYKVVEIGGKQAIVDENGGYVSPLLDYIYPDVGLLKNQSPYYIGVDDDKMAIFDKDGNMVTPGWFKFIFPVGLVDGTGEIYVVGREDGKVTIFDKDGKMLGQGWFDYIYIINLEKGQEEYVAIKDGSAAVFDRNGNQKTEWKKIGITIPEFNSKVFLEKLAKKMSFFEKEEVKQLVSSTVFNKKTKQLTVDDLSNYEKIKQLTADDLSNKAGYKIVEIGGKQAIVDENGRYVSPLLDYIYPDAGLPKNQSPYYIGVNNGKMAIFDKNGNMISQGWFKFIFPQGLVEGGKELYAALREDNKMTIFDVNGEQRIPWFDIVYPLNSFRKEGEEVFLAIQDGNMAIFDENGNQLTEWQRSKIFIDNLHNIQNIKYHENLGILEITDKQGNSTVVELEYKEDLELKKGLSAPGM
jgi:hypothetical protein